MKSALAAVAIASTLFAGGAAAGTQDSFSGSRGVFLAKGSFYNYCQGLVRQADTLTELSGWSFNDVPAPGSIALLAVGILGAACGRRRAAQNQNVYILNPRSASSCPICQPLELDQRIANDHFGFQTA